MTGATLGAPPLGAPSPGAPALSVVVPAHRCAPALRRSLAALAASDLPRGRWELIVVDDASGDDTPRAAQAWADRVLRLEGGPRGPAYARNRGAAVARGDVLAFVDADVCVHPDALRRFVDLFAAEPDVGAAFGAYDTRPPAPGVVSRYCNLVHHYVHAGHAGDAETFWAGCGAVRRDAFRRAGGFHERRYVRPQIEDIELGHRVRDLGYRILLRPEIQGTHLKRWTLRSMTVASVRDRGVPWVELLLEEGAGARASALNVGAREKVYTALVGLAGACVVAALVARSAWWLLPALAALLAVLAGNAPLLGWLWRQGGARLGVASAALRLVYYVLNGVSVAWGLARHLRARGVRRPAPARASTGDLPVGDLSVGDLSVGDLPQLH